MRVIGMFARLLVYPYIFIGSIQAGAATLPNPRPSVDVAWFRTANWSSEVTCSGNGCHVSVDEKEGLGYSLKLFSNELKTSDCSIDLAKQEVFCQADNIDLFIGKEFLAGRPYPSKGASLTLKKSKDQFSVVGKDAEGKVLYESQQVGPYMGCAFNVPEGAGYVGVFGSRGYQPFETVILPDGRNYSACDSREVVQPVKLSNNLTGKNIQCLNEDFSLQFDASTLYPSNSANERGPYHSFLQDLKFNIQALTPLAKEKLGQILEKSATDLSWSSQQTIKVSYENSTGIWARSSVDPYAVTFNDRMKMDSADVPVRVGMSKNENNLRVRLDLNLEGGDAYFSDFTIPISSCSVN